MIIPNKNLAGGISELVVIYDISITGANIKIYIPRTWLSTIQKECHNARKIAWAFVST